LSRENSEYKMFKNIYYKFPIKIFDNDYNYNLKFLKISTQFFININNIWHIWIRNIVNYSPTLIRLVIEHKSIKETHTETTKQNV